MSSLLKKLSRKLNLFSSKDNSLYTTCYKNNARKTSHKWGHFLPIYDRLLKYVVNEGKPITLLEIGVQNGGSLEVWNQYLSKDSKIYGVDINPECEKVTFSDNITFILGDASNKEFLEKHFSDTKFDVIVDDASHLCSHVIATFEALFDKLSYGGLYIIEDMHVSYFPEYEGGGRLKSSSIEYFKRLIEAVNFRHLKESDYNKLEPNEREMLEKLNKQIASITFYDSVVVIEKYLQEIEKPFDTYYTNGESLVQNLSNLKDGPKLCDKDTKFDKIYRDM